MLHLLKQKSLFRRSLCIALVVSLCCIPLFGCGRTDPIGLPPEDDIVLDGADPFESRFDPDMLAALAGLDLSDETLEILSGMSIGYDRLRELAELNLDNEKLEALINGQLRFIIPALDATQAVPYELYANLFLSQGLQSKLHRAGIGNGGREPAAFGGLYLDDENMLVICIVDDDAQLKEKITYILGDSKYYYFRSVTYSWNYLHEVQNAICGFDLAQLYGGLEEFQKLFEGEDIIIVGYGVSAMHNAVLVSLPANPSEEGIASFKESFIDSSAVCFEVSRIVLA